MSTAMSTPLPTATPTRLQHSFSHTPHPHPLPILTVPMSSQTTRAAVAARRVADEELHRSVINRGAGFAIAARKRRGTAEEAATAEMNAAVETATNTEAQGATAAPQPPGTAPPPDANNTPGSAASPAPTAAASSPATPVPSSPAPPVAPPLSATAAALASSPTLLASEAMAALAKAGPDRSSRDVDALFAWVRLQGVEFFAEVDDATLRLLCARMHSRVCARREIVMREGTPADALFIMISGSVTIWNESLRDHEAVDAKIESGNHAAAAAAGNNNNGRPTIDTSVAADGGRVIRPAEGDPRTLGDLLVLLGRRPKLVTTIQSSSTQKPAFGELGLMSDQLRTATVIADGPPTAPTSFLIIDKVDFDTVLKRRAKDAFVEKIMVLRKLKVFSAVSERQLVKLSLYFEEKRLPANAVVIAQGDVADTIIFLVEGEVEVSETIAVAGGGGSGGSGSTPSRTEQVHLGLIGSGELITDAAVFETPLLHPWTLVSRTSVVLYCIPAEDLTKRLRADVLHHIRRLSFAKKDLRDKLRLKAHRTNAKLTRPSPRMRQAQKLLAQIACEKQAKQVTPSTSPSSSSSTASKSGARSGTSTLPTSQLAHAPLPPAIRRTVLKNVIAAERAAEEEARRSTPRVQVIDSVAAARPSTSLSPTRPRQIHEPTDDRPSTALTIADPSLRRDDDVTASSGGSVSPTKGTLLVQRNPFAYDHRTFISPRSAEKLAALTASAHDLIDMLTADEEEEKKKHSASTTTRRGPPVVSTMLTSNVARQPYPFDHIHTVDSGVPSQPALVAPPDLTPLDSLSPTHLHSPRHGPSPSSSSSVRSSRRPSISMHLGPGGSLSVGLPDGAVHTITEDEVPDVPLSDAPSSSRRRHHHERRPSTSPHGMAAIVQSQIRGHQRRPSVHRGSVVNPNPLPFAVESSSSSELHHHHHHHPHHRAPSIVISEDASQIAAPILILPTPPSVVSTAITPAALPLTVEPIQPVASFAHLPATFYPTVPERQYYGRIDFRRPSITVTNMEAASLGLVATGHTNTNTNTNAAVTPSGSPNSTSGGSGNHNAGVFQRPSPLTLGEGSLGPSVNSPSGARRPVVSVTPRLSISARADPTVAHPSPPSSSSSSMTLPPPPASPFSFGGSGRSTSDTPTSAGGRAPPSRAGSTRDLHAHGGGGGESSRSRRVSMSESARTPAAAGSTSGGGGPSGMSIPRTAALPASALAHRIPASVITTITDDDDGEGEIEDQTASHRSRASVLLSRAAASLVADPLLLQKESRKWDRQLAHWHRKLVVASSAFLEPNNTNTVATARPSGSPTRRVVPPTLTPENVDVFTTRAAEELTASELASPLTLVPNALPSSNLACPPPVPYLYPTMRETGSMRETRALNQALGNLQVAIATNFTQPSLTRGDAAAMELARSESTRKYLKEELALKRVFDRMRPEDELIRRVHYIPREVRATISTKQAERRQRMAAQEWPANLNDSSASETSSSRRRRKPLDIGLESRKSPEQRAAEKAELERRKTEREEAKAAARREEQHRRLATANEQKRLHTNTAAAANTNATAGEEEAEEEKTQASTTFGATPASEAVDAPQTNDSVPTVPRQPAASLSLSSTSSNSVTTLEPAATESEREAILLARLLHTLQKPGSFLANLLMPKKKEEEEEEEEEEATTQAVSAIDAMSPLPSTIEPKEEKEEEEEEEKEPSLVREPSSLPPRVPTSSSRLATPHLPHQQSPPSVPRPLVASSRDHRLLRVGVLELTLDKELEYGSERYFEDRAHGGLMSQSRVDEMTRLVNEATAGEGNFLAQAAALHPQTSTADLIRPDTDKVLAALQRQAEMEEAERRLALTEAASTKTTRKTSPIPNEGNVTAALLTGTTSTSLAFHHHPLASSAHTKTYVPKRPLVALTQHDGHDTLLLGSSAPRLYHWTAMVHAAGVGSGSKVGSSDPETKATTLSEDSLRHSLRRSVPPPPRAIGGGGDDDYAAEWSSSRSPTLAELNSEIDHYRRDLRGGTGSRARDHHLHHERNGSGLTMTSHTGDGSSSSRTAAAGAPSHSSRARYLARKLQRDLVGSIASPMEKILKLRKYDTLVGMAGSMSARAPTVTAESIAGLLPPTSRDDTAATTTQWSARRFWRQSFHKRHWTRADMLAHARRTLGGGGGGGGDSEDHQHEEEEEEEKLMEEPSPVAITPALPSRPETRGTLIRHLVAPRATDDDSKLLPLTGVASSLPEPVVASSGATAVSLPSLAPPPPSSPPVATTTGLCEFTPALAAIVARSQPPAKPAVAPSTNSAEEFYQYLRQRARRNNLFTSTERTRERVRTT